MASTGPGPEQPGAPAGPPPAYGGSSGTSGKAIASLVLGILAFLIWPLGIAGIILGVMARNDITRSPGLGGNALAISGIVLSVIFIVLGVIGAVIILS
jgi:hypothetical protein